MTVSAEQLRVVMLETAALEKEVHDLISPPLPMDHVVFFDPGISASFLVPDVQKQTPTWVNGGPTFWCCGVGFTVWESVGSSTARKLLDSGIGIGRSDAIAKLFNFRWNMTKLYNRTGLMTSYVMAPGSVDSLLSYQALGNQETGRVLRFEPWPIERGDSLMFTIKPVGYDWLGSGDFSTSARVTVAIGLYGFRDQGAK